MADSEETLLKNDVAIVEINNLTSRLARKRTRSLDGLEEKALEQKRKKETFSDDIDEIELRDKLLDEASSSQLSLDSDNINNVSEFDHGGCNESQEAGHRKIIKLEGALPNLALPDGWIALNHRSGGIVYLHRSTRVCTWARPYYIGKGSVRKHDVPVAAIPCLHQGKALANKSTKTNKPSNEVPHGPDHQSGQGLSILNFLNTAGSMEDEACKSNQLIIGKPADVICDDGYTNFDSGLSVEKYDNYHCEQTCNTSESNSLQENAVNYDDNISNIVDGGDSERNQVYSTVETENEHSKVCHVNGSALIDGSHGDTDGTRYICPYKDTSDVFHPKDGLDVVNETLSHRMKELTKDDEPSSVNYVPIPSTKLMAPEHLPNINMKGTQSDKANHETNILQIENNGSSEEEINFYIPQNLNLKGDTKEKNENIPLAEAESNESNADDKKVKFLELQTTSDNNFKKNWNLPKTIHQTSGIELIDAEELGYYFGKLFEFEKLTVDQEQNAVTPSEPVMEEADPILSALECLPYCVKGKNAKENKEWVLNPGGKTPVAILHEYSQAVLKEKPVYVSTECENPSTPFMAEVQINGITHGSGVASTKKQAKQIAAEVALEVLLPNAFNKIRDYVISREELECFDKMKIDNPNIHELSIKSGLPSPSQVLQECLKRNQGVCSSTIHFKMIPGQNQDHTFVISCGKHTAKGPCKNKRIGKQVASQALLMKLHPHISTWGSLLRIYCDRPSSIVKKYKTPNQDSLSNCVSTPDVPRGKLLLARLKEEMLKIADNVNQESKYSRPNDDVASISTVDI